MAAHGIKAGVAAGVAVAVAMATMVVMAGTAVAAPDTAGSLTEYPGSMLTDAAPEGITTGPDGNLWFAESYGNKIGMITPAGVMAEFSTGISAGANPYDITTGPDGNVWFTEYGGGRVAKIDLVTHQITEYSNGIINQAYSNPTYGSGPTGITAGPDGNLWFTDIAGDRIGKITTSGQVTEYQMTTDHAPDHITEGPDGNLWFTEDKGYIGTFNPSTLTTSNVATAVTEYPVKAAPGQNEAPVEITSGPDGNLWYTNNAGGIGKISTSGVQLAEYAPPSASPNTGNPPAPQGITVGSDGNVWYVDNYGDTYGRVTPSGVITVYPLPTNENAYDITAGPDGNLWMTEGAPARIARIGTGATVAAAATASPASPTTGQAVTFDASSSVDPNPHAGSITYSWSFDDGSTASGMSVTHAFATAGSHTAVVTVTDSQGVSGTASAAVSVSVAPSPSPTPTPTASSSSTPSQTDSTAPTPIAPVTPTYSSTMVTRASGFKAGTVNVPTSVVAKMSAVTVLQADASPQVSNYSWLVHNPAGTEGMAVRCGADPVVGISGAPAGTHPVTLSDGLATGESAVANAAIATDGYSARQTATAEVATCGRSAAAIVGGLTSTAQLLQGSRVAANCSDQVYFDTVDARGCTFRVTSASAVPLAERSVLNFMAGGFGVSICGLSPGIHRVCNSAAPHTVAVSDAAIKAWDVRVAAGSVDVNGLRVTPMPGAHVVLVPQLGRIVSSLATIRISGVPVWSGPLNLDVRDPKDVVSDYAAEKNIFSLNPSNLPGIGGFHLDGYARASFVRDGIDYDYFDSGACSTNKYESRRCGGYHTDLDAFLQLPKGSAVFGDNPPSAGVFVTANNDEGLNLDHLKISVPQADLGAVQLSNIQFEYMRHGDSSPWWNNSWDRGPCAHNWWKATADVSVGGVYVHASPQPPEYGIAFCDGGFANGGLSVGGEIVPGVDLSGGVSIRLNPTVFDGQAVLTVADAVRITAEVLVAYGTPEHPYVMDQYAPSAFQAIKDALNDDSPVFSSTTIAAAGAVAFNLPLVGWTNFASGYVLHQDPGYTMFGGQMDINPGIRVTGQVGFEMNTDTHQYYGHGELRAYMPNPFSDVYVHGEVSNRGVAGCGQFSGWNPGFGLRWGEHIQLWTDSVAGSLAPEDWIHGYGCQSGYVYVKVTRPGSARRGASMREPTVGDPSFTVSSTEHVKAIELSSATGAPSLTVTAPNGETNTTDVSQPGPHLMTVRWPAQNRTWIFVRNPLPGFYKVTLAPGSVPITGIRGSVPVDTRPVKGTARWTGGRVVLTYNAGSLAHRTVTFLESGGGVIRTIGTAAASTGTITYTPAMTHAEKREIIAVVTLDGMPPNEEHVTTFKYSGPPRLAAPSMRIVRGRGTVAAYWLPVAGATGYTVTLQLRNGDIRVVNLRSGSRVARFPRVPQTTAGSVTVAAVGALGTQGRGTVKRFAQTRNVPSRLLPFNELRSHHWRYYL